MSVAATGFYECPYESLSVFCSNLALVKERDQVFVASAGNFKYPVGFPANDPRAIAVGGVERDLSSPLGFDRWDDCSGTGNQCGSNHGIEMDVVAPAKEVLSTVFTELDHLADCGDSSAGNTDTDYDGLIDGFEDLVGTKKNVADTDCDGISDGAEVNTYEMTLHGYRDPLAGPCTYLFADGFETGNTARWSSTSFLDDGIEF